MHIRKSVYVAFALQEARYGTEIVKTSWFRSVADRDTSSIVKLDLARFQDVRWDSLSPEAGNAKNKV
jgi:hypothetical protein